MSSTSTTWSTQGNTKAGASSTSTDSLTTGTLTADTIQLASNVIKASDGGNTITLNTSDDVTIAGDLIVTGNNITFGNGEGINNISDGIMSYTGASTYKFSSHTGSIALQLIPTLNQDANIQFYERTAGGPCVWGIGNDAGSSDILKFDTGATVGGATKLSLDTSGNMEIAGDLTVTGGNITVTGAPSYTATTQTARNADTATTIGPLQDVVQTLIDDLQDIGILS